MRLSIAAVGLLIFLTGMTGGAVIAGYLLTKPDSQSSATSTTVKTEPTETINQPWQFATHLESNSQQFKTNFPNFTNVAESTVNAVTNISSRQVVRRQSIFTGDPFFRYFFEDSQDLFGYRERPSLGSAVIVQPNGYILTNAHVVGPQTAGITVTLADNREFEAELIGRDESTDIALIRIDANNLPTVPWGDSSKLRIAEWVLAVGNPFQLSQTVTLGIVSAVGRDNLGVARYEDFIQTDAAINPGNSGGALINSHGDLIGINTAIYSDSGGSQGVGFAVPSNLARRVMDDLIQYGAVRRGSFGYVDVRNLTPQLARELNAEALHGVVVWRIHQASAASKAGLEPGDIIISFNNELLHDVADYARLLSDATIGSQAALGVVRSGKKLDFQVEVSQAQ